MKKILSTAMILTFILANLAGCSGGGSSSNSSTTVQTTQSTTAVQITTSAAKTAQPTTEQVTMIQPTTEQSTTVQPTTKQPTTEKPTEISLDSVYQAYLDYLEDIEGNFYYKDEQGICIADVTDDDIPELIYVKTVGQKSNFNLVIMTYESGSLKTLYDDYLVAIPSGGPAYYIFIGEDNNMYGVAWNADGYESFTRQYVCNGNDISEVVLYAYKNTSYVSSGYDADYITQMEENAKCMLVRNMNPIDGVTDYNMTYDEACEYLASK